MIGRAFFPKRFCRKQNVPDSNAFVQHTAAPTANHKTRSLANGFIQQSSPKRSPDPGLQKGDPFTLVFYLVDRV